MNAPISGSSRATSSRRPRRLWIAPALVALVATCLGISALGLARGWWRFNHPDPGRFPVWGIDVSHHQGRIDWRTVAGEPHLAFAYVKATEGGDWVDARFRENWSEARRAGLRVGAYHFFTFCRPALDQARNFLSVLPRDPGALPPAVDLEYGGNCARRPGRREVLDELALWLRVVGGASGSRPVVYVTQEAYEELLDGSDLGHPIWIRGLWSEPRLRERWTFWQFANRGRVRGIDAFVDLNVFDGSREALDRL